VQQLQGTARPNHGSARYRTDGFCNKHTCLSVVFGVASISMRGRLDSISAQRAHLKLHITGPELSPDPTPPTVTLTFVREGRGGSACRRRGIRDTGAHRDPPGVQTRRPPGFRDTP
jgi:hypothetical protein